MARLGGARALRVPWSKLKSFQIQALAPALSSWVLGRSDQPPKTGPKTLDVPRVGKMQCPSFNIRRYRCFPGCGAGSQRPPSVGIAGPDLAIRNTNTRVPCTSPRASPPAHMFFVRRRAFLGPGRRARSVRGRECFFSVDCGRGSVCFVCSGCLGFCGFLPPSGVDTSRGSLHAPSRPARALS